MSTNYYLNHPEDGQVHIGKSSLGWQFLFNVANRSSADPVDSFDAWMSYLDLGVRKGATMEDEYGRPITLPQLRTLIVGKQLDGKNGWTASVEMIGPWADARRRNHMDVMETYCRKGFRFSTASEFS